jgi:hypothetical protein
MNFTGNYLSRRMKEANVAFDYDPVANKLTVCCDNCRGRWVPMLGDGGLFKRLFYRCPTCK